MSNNAVLLRKWYNIINRLNSLSPISEYYRAISITILVGPDGEPKFWTEPNVTKFEPRGTPIGDIILILSGLEPIILIDEGAEEIDTE